jgi:hypothetical protein
MFQSGDLVYSSSGPWTLWADHYYDNGSGEHSNVTGYVPKGSTAVVLAIRYSDRYVNQEWVCVLVGSIIGWTAANLWDRVS